MPHPTVAFTSAMASGTGAVPPATGGANVAIGDLLLVFATGQWATSVPATPANYAIVGTAVTQGTQNNAAAIRSVVFWKRATANSEAFPSVGDFGAQTAAVGVVVKGIISSGTPYEANANGNGLSGTASFASISALGPDRLWMGFIGTGADSNAAQVSSHTPAAELLNSTVLRTGSSNAGGGVGVYVVEGEKTSSGAISATNATLAGSQEWNSIQFFVLPAPDTTPATITSSSTASVQEGSALAHSLTANETVSWSIRSTAQNAASLDATHFEISGSTLRWTGNGVKDFESPGDSNGDNAYVVVVRATDNGSNTTDQTITVTVTDRDEQAPTITSSASPTVQEGTAFSHSLTANESVTWSITGGADQALFSLTGNTLSMTARDYEAPVDSDENNVYVVQVTATDTASNTTNQTINVTVTDLFADPATMRPDGILSISGASGVLSDLRYRDGSWAVASSDTSNPVIRVSFPTATAPLQAGADLQNITVQARKFNANSGNPTLVIRVLNNGTVVATSGSFSVTSTTQEEFVFPFDFSVMGAGAVYGSNLEAEVEVTAAGGGPSARNSADVGLIVWEATFDATTPTITSTNTASVQENQPLNKSLTADESVTWSITGGADAARFEIFNNSALRFLSNASKDYENPDDSDANNTYVVTVRATDLADNYSEQTITVTVTNIVPPVWSSSATVNVNENSVLSHTLTTTAPSNKSLVGGADLARFELSGDVLRWVGNGTKDYENPDDSDANNTYVVTARAESGGEITDQTITVTVGNLAAPVFTSGTGISVTENATLAHTLTVSSGSPLFTIVGGADAADFELSGATLRWTGNGTKDYELPDDANGDNIYVVTVRATENGESTDQTINVSVLNSLADDDLTPPTITSSSTANVAENATLAHSLTADESVTWSIRTSGENAASVDHTHFELSGSTLRWTGNGTKNFEAPGDTDGNNTYVVVVRATDGAGHTTDQTITVTVTNVFEQPSLNALTGSLSVTENSPNGTVVGTPTGFTAGSSRSLSDNAGGRFAINATSGQITVVDGSLLNYENNTSHSVTVVETLADSANSPRSTVMTIDVTDVDEIAPTITSRVLYRQLPGKSWSINLTADEAVTWTKTGGANAADFTLTGNTLTLSAKPQRQTYVVQVTATDAASNVSSATITVTTVKRRRPSVTL